MYATKLMPSSDLEDGEILDPEASDGEVLLSTIFDLLHMCLILGSRGRRPSNRNGPRAGGLYPVVDFCCAPVGLNFPSLL